MDAVIDIGSNSVRLLLKKTDGVNAKELDSTSLADGLALTGALSAPAMARTSEAVKRFTMKAEAEGAENIYIFGTEAMRAASNSEEFRIRLQEETGHRVHVVSGDTEAKLGLYGAMTDMPPGEITVIDIGGASVEIVRGNYDRITYCKSLPLGMVRLIDVAGTNRADIENYVSKNITAFGPISGWEAAAIGGTATSLASMDLNQKKYDAREVHGHILTLGATRRLTDKIFASKSVTDDFPSLSPKRARIIGHGAIMLSALTEYLGLNEVRVSEFDNMEGYLFCIKNGLLSCDASLK